MKKKLKEDWCFLESTSEVLTPPVKEPQQCQLARICKAEKSRFIKDSGLR